MLQSLLVPLQNCKLSFLCTVSGSVLQIIAPTEHLWIQKERCGGLRFAVFLNSYCFQ